MDFCFFDYLFKFILQLTVQIHFTINQNILEIINGNVEKKEISASILCTCVVIPENANAWEKMWGLLQNYYVIHRYSNFSQIKRIFTPELLEKIIPVIRDIVIHSQEYSVIFSIMHLLFIIYNNMHKHK